jgi:Zinc carboxypeptidase
MARKTRTPASALRTLVLRAVVLTALAGAARLDAQATKLTSPKEHFGFNIGDDYRVANYTQLEAYIKKLAGQSPRLKVVDIGATAEGRHQYMAIITSPENQRKLEHYKDISRKLALAEGVSEEQAHALSREGKSVIFMDFGLHATETVGSQAFIELVYQMTSRNDEETLRLLNDDILLLCLANPDGMELVANWYMREADETKRSLDGVPRLWQKYIGHDNARDMYMSNQAETININKVLFSEWFPQITHTHHQTGPAGAVVFMPPFRDPFNYGFDPLVITELDQVGSAMHSRLISKGMPGSAMRGAANYSTWFNGAMRTISYFHNMVGLLTEIIGSPNPMQIPLVLEHQLPDGNEPMPIAPQTWHYRQSIDYEMEYSRAVFDVASRYRETFLFNIWRMGQNAIDRGNRDNWTITPKRIAAAESAAVAARPAGRGGDGAGGGRGSAIVPTEIYNTVLHDPKMRDARGYVIPSSQADFATATRFVNVLLKNGISVLRASAPFEFAGKIYPVNSFVVRSAQAARPFVLDMFEPQDHPDDFKYPGAAPTPPYDVAGWTLAYSMGVKFDRILDAFDGPFVKVNGLQPPLVVAMKGATAGSPAGYLISHRDDNAFALENRLMKAKADAFWLKDAQIADGEELGAGALWVPASPAAKEVIDRSVKDLGIAVHALAGAPAGELLRIKPIRVGVVDIYGGNIPTGWTKWLFEQFEMPYDVVYPQTLDAGDLRSKFDVLVFPDGSARFADGGRGGRGGGGANPESVPAEYRAWLGSTSREKTIPQLKKFAEGGGTIVAIGNSTAMAELLGVPVKNYLTEKTPDGRTRAIPPEKFYIPGSLLKMTINNKSPLAYGMPETADVMFNNSPTFRLEPDAETKHTSAVAWFSGTKLLSSGWAWGQQYLDGGAAVVDASIGSGKLLLLGPEVAFRGQTYGSFKLLFNALYYGSAKSPTAQ